MINFSLGFAVGLLFLGLLVTAQGPTRYEYKAVSVTDAGHQAQVQNENPDWTITQYATGPDGKLHTLIMSRPVPRLRF